MKWYILPNKFFLKLLLFTYNKYILMLILWTYG